MLPKTYDGSGTPERLTLKAGALTMMYEQGTLRYLRMGEYEVVRMIYAALRDHNWETIAPVLHDVRLKQGVDHFSLTFTSEHQHRDIDFVWHGSIVGTADNTVTFSFEGEARSTFKRNRIGFCVLHPMDLAGAPCTLEHTDGTHEQNMFPLYIAPHQPFFDLRAITHTVMDGVQVEVRMEGDTFELEDQRNWSDASYKTYCTPLVLPFPALVEAGTRISQRVTVRLLGDVPALNPEPTADSLTFDVNQAVLLPPIGLGMASHGEPLTVTQIDRLRALNLAHLRADIRADGDIGAALHDATTQARALGCGLELALHLTDDVHGQLVQVREAVNTLQAPITRWLIFKQGEKSTSRATIAAAREILASTGAVIGAGTDAFFTQLNRERPAVDLLDWVCYSINPQIHASDNATMIENLPTQAATLQSARQFSGAAKIAITPVTLKMRWSPDATAAPAPPPEGQLPPQVDPRQLSLFGAGWTLGSVKALALGGADSLTYYETVGWRGVMERESGSPLPEKFASQPHALYPMYHVFAVLGAFRNGLLSGATSSDPLRFEGVALMHHGALCVLLVNYSAETITLSLNGLSGAFDAAFLEAVHAPDGWGMSQALSLADGVMVTLPPHALLRLDART